MDLQTLARSLSDRSRTALSRPAAARCSAAARHAHGRYALWLVLIVAVALAQILPMQSRAVQASSPGSRISWQGSSWYLHGANVPWYGWACDFGCGPNSGGVSASWTRDILSQRFAQARASGIRVLRWWTLPGNAWQINRDANDHPTSLNPAVYADFDAALQLAEQHDLYYNFVLFSGASGIPAGWLSDPTQRAKLAAALTPLFARYNGNPRVLSWEVFNEPDFDVWNDRVTEANLKATVQAVANAVHANSSAMVTVGMGFADGLPMVKGAGLDYYQAHWYDYMGGGTYCMRCNSYSWYQSGMGLDAPLVVGESYASASTDALQRFEDFYSKGYAGYWAWSLFPERTYDQMSVDLSASATFAGRHADLGPRGGSGPLPTSTPAAPTATPSATPPPATPTATATATASATPTATSTPAGPTRTPTVAPTRRPGRGVKVRTSVLAPATAGGQSRLQVTVSASSVDGPANALHELRFGQPQNATVDVGALRGQRGPLNYSVSQSTAELTFTVNRLADGAYFVPFTVVDEDGLWTTFVGAGR
ncbi:MAG: cellulase family glycosylhydrolase [Chloroflexi bacterium]|nr:cellulase family glycosylhydrolase [Chloroflexota bacterium]